MSFESNEYREEKNEQLKKKSLEPKIHEPFKMPEILDKVEVKEEVEIEEEANTVESQVAGALDCTEEGEGRESDSDSDSDSNGDGND